VAHRVQSDEPSTQHMKKQNRRRLAAASIGTLVLALHPASAQETSPVSATTAADSEVVTLEEFTINETSVESATTLLPTSRPVDSLYGFNRSLVDTPRAATVISPQVISQRGLDDVYDLAALVPGSTVTNYYGVPGIPTTRGLFTSIYFNGMQRVWNRNG
jgi:iron complex outermembrane receptor protein